MTTNINHLRERLECPLTCELFEHPMTETVCGHTFEQKIILEWLQESHTCPMSRKPLTESQLIYNKPVKEACVLLNKVKSSSLKNKHLDKIQRAIHLLQKRILPD